jgi:hypothetical protein
MRLRPLLLLIPLALLLAGASPRLEGRAADLPDRLADQDFWKLTEDLSEPDGTFRSENLLSNEMAFARLLPELLAKAKPGGVYLGVGPEQNFTYIAALRSRMAFITDIRRGNLHVLLMYKALFELSANRADFISRLFTKPRPAGLMVSSTAQEIMEAFWNVPTASQTTYDANLDAIQKHLTRTRSIPLPPADLEGVARAYKAYYWYGPAMNYSATTSLTGGGGGATYRDLMSQADQNGRGLTFLASEEKFNYIKDLFARNLIVPLVGNFSGPKTIRAIGDWVRSRGATVSAFYVSTVEPYLRRDGSFPTWCGNVETLPVDDASVFIRPGNVQNLGATLSAEQRQAMIDSLRNVPPIGIYQTGVIVPIKGGCY